MVVVANHVPSFTYDSMGNMTQDNLGKMYTYDAEGRPIAAAGVNTTLDALGRAVELNNGGAYTQIVYSPSGSKFAWCPRFAALCWPLTWDDG